MFILRNFVYRYTQTEGHDIFNRRGDMAINLGCQVGKL